MKQTERNRDQSMFQGYIQRRELFVSNFCSEMLTSKYHLWQGTLGSVLIQGFEDSSERSPFVIFKRF